MLNTPDEEDPVAKAGHLSADLIIDAKIGELRPVFVYVERRIAELEELKRAKLEDKNEALRSSFPTPA
jgi:hypothetical protein